MILVRRDASLIPSKLLAMAERAKQELETKTEEKRPEFIRKKSRIWRLFGRYLAEMSYGKCWYSESPDPQSFFDVDHFRPKLEARRSESDVDKPGYEWLAFSWDNFRYAANCSNRLIENIETGAVEGKGSWFPLLNGSPKATWGDRCEATEQPLLLDPVIQRDVDLIEVSADGRIIPGKLALGTAKTRVERSCELYGLNLPGIKEARVRLMREIIGQTEVLNEMIAAGTLPESPASVGDRLPVQRQAELLKQKTFPNMPYSRAARAALVSQGWGELCASPECFAAAQAA